MLACYGGALGHKGTNAELTKIAESLLPDHLATLRYHKQNPTEIIKMRPLMASSSFGGGEIGAAYAMLLALEEHDKNPEVLIHTPFALDATCSGIQVVSMILGDRTTAQLVNVEPVYLDDNTEVKADIYGMVA